jgi:hypothetical protein
MVALSARAQTEDELMLERDTGFSGVRRPAGMAEVGVDMLTLPGAEVCVERSKGCEQGDTSFGLEIWQLYRAHPRLAFGAGAALALITTTDAPRSDPEGITRDHNRGYLTVEGIVRYYPYVERTIEAWVGLVAGLVVVSDSFKVQEETTEKALVGPRGTTIRTEGYTVGLAVGAAYALSPQWSLGANLRYGNWFLPQDPERDVLGDEASLTGRNTMFALALGVGYRISL